MLVQQTLITIHKTHNMKRVLFSISAAVLLLFCIAGCEKNKFHLKDTNFIEGKASLKVNFFSSYQKSPFYQIKVDGIRMSNLLTYPTPFPGGGLNTGGGNYGDYLAIDPGKRKVSISLPFAGTSNDSVELASATIDLQANKIYSFYFTDTATNTFTRLLEDNLTSPDSGFIRYRFINLIPDLPEGYDLYFGTDTTVTTSTKVSGPILYKETSSYFTVPLNTGTVWAIRKGNSAANSLVLFRYVSASTVVNQRVFTISTRGYNSITSTTDPRRRQFSFIYNR
jgi:Domain of unknown function (DUF4397)